RPARALRLALRIESLGDGERVGVDFEERVQARAPLVSLLDTRQIFLRDGARGEPARLHALLEISDRKLVQLEGLDFLPGRGRRQAFVRAGQSRQCDARGAAENSGPEQASSAQS